MIDNLKKAEAIKKTVARMVRQGAWLSAAQKDAAAWLDRSEKDRRADVDRYVEEQYAAAGLDARGRKGS